MTASRTPPEPLDEPIFGGALDNRSMPAATVIPVLHYPDVAAASDWLCRAFGFSLRLRIGDHRAQLRVGDGAVVVARASRPLPEAELASHSLMVRVRDADRHCERARQNGARILGEPATQPYGERQYTAGDPAGRLWVFSQSSADTAPAEWGGEWGAPPWK